MQFSAGVSIKLWSKTQLICVFNQHYFSEELPLGIVSVWKVVSLTSSSSVF